MGTAEVARAGRKLSGLQREILRRLVAAFSHGGARKIPLWRISGRRQKGVRSASSSEKAAFSRALARQEVRGLLVRSNEVSGLPDGPRKGYIRQSADEPHRRTTALGRRVAETVNTDGGCQC
jgi:hypothetical protein